MAAIDQILRNTGAQLSNTFYVNGAAQDADGAVTVVATSADGTELANEQADDDVASDGKYEWTMPPQADLTRLTMKWTGTFSGTQVTATTYAEIVGGFLFTLAEARAFKTSLANEVKYPNSTIIDVREEIAQLFENFCRVSFIPRYRRDVLDGDGKRAIYLPRREVRTIQSLTEDGTALTDGTDYYSYENGRLARWNATWSNLTPKNVVVDYEHGFEIPPGPIVRCALIVLEDLIVGSDIFNRAVSQTDEAGTIRLSYADDARNRPTGIPWVDARLNEYLDVWGVE